MEHIYLTIVDYELSNKSLYVVTDTDETVKISLDSINNFYKRGREARMTTVAQELFFFRQCEEFPLDIAQCVNDTCVKLKELEDNE